MEALHTTRKKICKQVTCDAKTLHFVVENEAGVKAWECGCCGHQTKLVTRVKPVDAEMDALFEELSK